MGDGKNDGETNSDQAYKDMKIYVVPNSYRDIDFAIQGDRSFSLEQIQSTTM